MTDSNCILLNKCKISIYKFIRCFEETKDIDKCKGNFLINCIYLYPHKEMLDVCKTGNCTTNKPP